MGNRAGRNRSLPVTHYLAISHNLHALNSFCVLFNDAISNADYIKVKVSRNRPGVAQSVPGGLGSQIPWHSALEGGEVVSLTHRPPLPPRNVPGTHFH